MSFYAPSDGRVCRVTGPLCGIDPAANALPECSSQTYYSEFLVPYATTTQLPDPANESSVFCDVGPDDGIFTL
jgi:hypothetical protein